MNQFPLDYRWAKANGLEKMIPWHLEEDKQADLAYEKEKIEGHPVVTFARRQDCDDFAGFEIVEGEVTGTVVYFHPSFGDSKNECLVNERFTDFWTFITSVVIPDTKDWASEEDLTDLNK